jgi:hypothetical protein
MAARRAIESYAPASAAAEICRALWREIDERLTTLSAVRARGVAAMDGGRAANAGEGMDARGRATQGAVAGSNLRPAEAAEPELVGSPWSA